MIRRQPLDHDLLVDRSLRIYVVLGSSHPPGRVFSYIKYRPSGRRSPWIFRGVWLERVVERYSVQHVARAFEEHQEREQDPHYGSEMPFVRWDNIVEHMLPEERAVEVFTRPRDPLEVLASEAIERAARIPGISLSRIGVGGSILGSFHNLEASDIDLLVYGCREAEKIYWAAGELGEPLRGRDLERWASNTASIHRIPEALALELYAPYKRILYRGRHVAFTFPADPEPYGSRVVESAGKCVEARVFVEGGQCRALQYPGEAVVHRVLSAPAEALGLERIAIYEGAFSPLIYRGGSLAVRGSLAIVRGSGEKILALGTRECGGLARPSS